MGKSPAVRRQRKQQGRMERMYLLLAAHPDGAAIQRLSPTGKATADARVLTRGELAGVVREFEAQRPRWV
ncbi:hypothetical protein, partial [Paenarthrobacter nicotinovorans]|uniref:hypothetical protein n=1 Tax=Paenarthrobacter nicotinovorans TaxID=29320 RepID=UPI0024866AE4